MPLCVRRRDGIGDFSLVAGGRLWVSCHEMSNQRAAEQAGFLAFADGRAVVERVVSAGLDGVEDGEAAATEHIEIDAGAEVPQFIKRGALVEKMAGGGHAIFYNN